ncbi:hypothetical protein AAVH_27639 [Aphelenchoides avenae]|nr:hypothetical protein AAVH_27639 [Aphelenchus avenae]
MRASRRSTQISTSGGNSFISSYAPCVARPHAHQTTDAEASSDAGNGRRRMGAEPSHYSVSMRVKKEIKADARANARNVHPPATSDSDEEPGRYDVAAGRREGRKWFLIRWVGYAEPSWEPSTNAD